MASSSRTSRAIPTPTTREAGSNSWVAQTLAGTSTALEDFFAGLPTQAALQVGNPATRFISKVFGVFAQDDYRLTPKLMVNLGLRWEYRSPFHEVNNDVGNFDPTLGLVQQGHGSVGSTLWKPDYGDWSPRIGFAYDVTGKGTTVVRGGASILYSMLSIAPFTGNPGIANVCGHELRQHTDGRLHSTARWTSVHDRDARRHDFELQRVDTSRVAQLEWGERA